MKRITLAWEQKIVGCAPMLPLLLLCIYICAYFFWYFFIYFQRFSFDFQPNLPTFIFICYRFNTNPLLFLFFYSYRLSLVLMYAQRICLSHGHRLNSTHKPHWIALTEPVQSKYTLIQKRIYSYFIFDNVRQIYIYNFLVLFYFCCFGDFLRFSRRRFFFFFILPSSAVFSCFRQI